MQIEKYGGSGGRSWQHSRVNKSPEYITQSFITLTTLDVNAYYVGLLCGLIMYVDRLSHCEEEDEPYRMNE